MPHTAEVTFLSNYTIPRISGANGFMRRCVAIWVE